MAAKARSPPPRRILCVGVACIDDVMVIARYPAEGSTAKVLSRRRARGGNASNSYTVLALLGAPCDFMGKLGGKDSGDVSFLLSDFALYGVGCEHVVRADAFLTPLTVAVVSAENGSRTLLHHRGGLPELSYDEFRAASLDFGQYGWVHFEARYNEDDTAKELRAIDAYNSTVPEASRVRTSVGLEKPRRSLLTLAGAADCVFVGKDLATFLGYVDMTAAAKGLATLLRRGAVVVCPWGDRGAAAAVAQPSEAGANCVVVCPAFAPGRVVDTLGAGDAFAAATLLALSRGQSLPAAVAFGCRIAGAKCGASGFDSLADCEISVDV